jgi:hypothetical protein
MSWTPYQPGRRVYPGLSSELQRQLIAIPKATGFDAVPCKVTLDDGSQLERVYIQDAQSYIDKWGIWPEDDKAKRSLDVTRIVAIGESAQRLPVDIASRLYEAGESGMGYCVFTLIFRDGSQRTYVTGNAVDFVQLPAGMSHRDIIDVRPHTGDRDGASAGLDYYWCLYGSGEGRITS